MDVQNPLVPNPRMWGPIIDAFKPTKFFAWVGLCCLAIPLFAVGVVCQKADGRLQVFMGVLLFALCSIAGVSVILLLFTTTEWTLSGMLAQRWNPLSYLACYCVSALCYFGSGIICATYVIHDMNGHNEKLHIAVFSTTSLIIASLILIFPDVVKKTPAELGMTPTHFAHVHVVPENVPLFSPTIFPCIPLKFMSPIHMLLVAIGAVFGYYCMVDFLLGVPDDHFADLNVIAVMSCLISGGVTLIIFLGIGIDGMVDGEENHPKMRHLRFAMELAFLFDLITGIILTSLSDSDLFQGYTNEETNSS